ncbi:hypothetical protein [Draconibacterium halophilum]|uniref:Uncharacterized protein n=1 Tax=Draconibacterium halophilum TaxID=2706887 RepID=A0A6C0RG61_9BACT|nr:hypothetical protein [Draconibacterium halophilum]QIA08061.1 hypothetical protein G0Q07_10125 [Draconibacterium halophilum]
MPKAIASGEAIPMYSTFFGMLTNHLYRQMKSCCIQHGFWGNIELMTSVFMFLFISVPMNMQEKYQPPEPVRVSMDGLVKSEFIFPIQ